LEVFSPQKICLPSSGGIGCVAGQFKMTRGPWSQGNNQENAELNLHERWAASRCSILVQKMTFIDGSEG